MLSRLHKLAVVLIVILCLCCYIAEICDTWDATAPSGTDTEFSFVRILLCLGAAFVVAEVLRCVISLFMRARQLATTNTAPPFFLNHSAVFEASLCPTLSLALRI